MFEVWMYQSSQSYYRGLGGAPLPVALVVPGSDWRKHGWSFLSCDDGIVFINELRRLPPSTYVVFSQVLVYLLTYMCGTNADVLFVVVVCNESSRVESQFHVVCSMRWLNLFLCLA